MLTTRLTRQGNSTALTLSREILRDAGLDRGDRVVVTVDDGTVRITKADDRYTKTIEAARRFNERYKRTMRELAK